MMTPHPTAPRRSRELPVADGFGSLTLAPATDNHRRPVSRFFCLEAALHWRPARSRIASPSAPAANAASPTPAATLP